MRLTAYTDYSLRVLMFLALKGDELATIAEIAKAYAISKNHLMKVAHQLGVAGYVETVRGKGGGLRLALDPKWPDSNSAIAALKSSSFIDVQRKGQRMTLVPCFDPGDKSCAISTGCMLRGVLCEARDAFLATLDRYTLADLMRRRSSLQKFLILRPDSASLKVRSARRA